MKSKKAKVAVKGGKDNARMQLEKRLFFICSRLISKRRVTASEVAAKFKVSKRTVLRSFFNLVKAGLAKSDTAGLGIVLGKKK